MKTDKLRAGAPPVTGTSWYVQVDSPVGLIDLAASDSAVTMVGFADEAGAVGLKVLAGHPGTRVVAGENPILARLAAELTAYFDGRLRAFSTPLAPRGTPFQQAAWRALRDIPYGKTTSYSTQARAIGRPRAVRAVAQANGANPLAIVVPCHRVIGADGSLTGYGGGLERKRWLLQHEARHAGLDTR